MHLFRSKEALGKQLKVNVKDFGAVGDGKKNDGPAIQAAINYAAHKGSLANISNDEYEVVDMSTVSYPDSRHFTITQGGGTVYFPSGTYLIKQPLILPATGGNTSLPVKGFSVQLEGENATSTVICGAGDFCLNEPEIDPREVRALVEWAPQYNFEALEALGYGSLAQTPPVSAYTWEISRKIRELMALDDYANDLINQVFEVDQSVGETRLEYCIDLYEKAVSEMESQVHIPRDTEDTPLRDQYNNIIVERASYMFNRATNQRISNLTFYMPERPRVDEHTALRSYAIGRRWPWMITRPRLFERLEALLYKGKDKPYFWFPDETNRLALKDRWKKASDIYHRLHQMCSEGSRLQVKLENVDFMGGNSVHHPAYCHFEGSVINSEFRSIRARVSDEMANNSSLKTHCRSFHFDMTEFSSWLVDAGVLRDFDTPSHDTVLFEFDKGSPKHYGSDQVGLQFSLIENIWAYGKLLCVFKGRANSINWNFAFSDGALMGPSYHFINSANSFINNLQHEGGYDRHVFLIEHGMGMHFNGFGTGGQRLFTGYSWWPQFMKDRCRTLSSAIKLVESIGCTFDRRQAITPMHTSSYYEVLLRARAHNQANSDPLQQFIISDPAPAFVELDAMSYRNQFTNVEVTFAQTNNLNRVDYTIKDAQGVEQTEELVNWITKWIQADPEKAVNDFLNAEFRIPEDQHYGLNLISGWIYLHEFYQQKLNELPVKPDFYRFKGSNSNPWYTNNYEWGGIPFSIGRKVDDPTNYSHQDWA